MCRQYAQPLDDEELATYWEAKSIAAPPWRGAYSIAPTNRAPIFFEQLQAGGVVSRLLAAAQFGFTPTDTEPLRYNAQSENLRKYRFWRNAFRVHRCAVLMSGYFEFTGSKGAKTPHYIHHRDGEQLAAAGLYHPIGNPQDPSAYEMVIITRPAQGHASHIHSRMPLFLTREGMNTYLTPADHNPEEQAALREFALADSITIAPSLVSHLVSSKVNNTQTVNPLDAQLLAPLDDVESPLF